MASRVGLAYVKKVEDLWSSFYKRFMSLSLSFLKVEMKSSLGKLSRLTILLGIVWIGLQHY